MKTTSSRLASVLLASALIASTARLSATIIVQDSFDYPSGLLDQANTGSTWSRTGSGDSIQVVSDNLNYPGMPASTGGMVQWGGDGRISRRDFTAVTSGSIFVSFLLRVDNIAPLTTTGGAIAGLVNAANTANPNSRVYLRRDLVDTTAYNVGVLERGSPVTWSTIKLFAGQTQMIVFGLDFIDGVNNDVARLWLNPLASEFGTPTPPTETISASFGEDATAVNRFRLVQNPSNGSPGLLSFDELTIGTSWADVTPAPPPIPEPSAAALILIGGLSCLSRRRRSKR